MMVRVGARARARARARVSKYLLLGGVHDDEGWG